MRLKLWGLVGLCVLGTNVLAVVGCSNKPVTTTDDQSQGNFERFSDVVYATKGESELCLDIVVPSVGNGPFPAVLFLFGGGFKEGGKGGHSSDTIFAAQRGYVGVAADYSLTIVQNDGTIGNQFPEALHDVKAAVRWLREHAEEYHIDVNRIGASGISAGGNLALMLAVTDIEDGLEGDDPPYEYSSAVQAVVAAAPHPDFTDNTFQTNQYNRKAITRYLGGSIEEVPRRYIAASPVTYFDKNDSPALMIFGAQDPYVGMNQVRTAEDRMREAYTDHTLLIVAKGHHSFVELASPSSSFPLWDYFDARLKSELVGSGM